MSTTERCFACDLPLGTAPCRVDTRDGQTVFVGITCYRKVLAAGEEGYQPPKGGPRLYPASATISIGESMSEITHSDILEEIALERQRQKEREGFSTAHDDEHTDGELALAAASYAINAACHANPNQEPFAPDNPPEMWPWDIDWWKPKDARRDLIRAAALLVAEIERRDRAEGKREGDALK